MSFRSRLIDVLGAASLAVAVGIGAGMGLLAVPRAFASGPSLDAMMLKPLPERLREAERLYEERRYEDALEEYEVLARFGSKTAQYRLALIHLDELDEDADRIQGWVWAALAAEFGQVNYARLRDEAWATLSPAQQRAAWARFLDKAQIYSDEAVARSLMIKARRKRGMNTIAHGLRRDGSVKTYRTVGMKGDVLGPDNVLGILQQVEKVAESHYRGEHVRLGEFEVLEADAGESPDAAVDPLPERDR
ncbi:hypothetical protein [Elongatibacter sediminis]|uniref:Sel1 repeat family protein n=1 Tax=Elongatibacter sediminis TaxID=3119006 RepID=A0AAW9RDW2_9GAMM